MPVLRAVLLAIGAALLGGACSGDAIGRHAISGTVTVDGSPLAKGDISFQPVEGQATQGGSPITDGKYSVPKAGGLAAGKYQVEIHAPVPGTGAVPDENAPPGDPPPPPRELIPAEWNSASTQTIDVRPQGPFVFDFAISTKNRTSKKP